MSNGDSLEGVNINIAKPTEDPEVAEAQKIQRERKVNLEKELRHNRLQITRLQAELQSKSIDMQRDINRIKKDITERKFELEKVEHKLKKQNDMISLIKDLKQQADGEERLEEDAKVEKDVNKDLQGVGKEGKQEKDENELKENNLKEEKVS